VSSVFENARGKPERCRLLLDGALADEYEQLEQALVDATDEADQEILAHQVVDLEARMREAEVEFVFIGIGRGAWRRLVAKHPPSEDEKAAGAEFSIDNFPIEAMSASLVEPKLTVDELRRLNDEILTFEQYGQLWSACLRANVGSGSRPESLAARAILANGGGKSQQPSKSESAAASS
jgi:hypothetical protein